MQKVEVFQEIKFISAFHNYTGLNSIHQTFLSQINYLTSSKFQKISEKIQ